MNKKQLLELLAKVLPEQVMFELHDRKPNPKTGVSHGQYGIAEVAIASRHGFSVGNVACEGTPKLTLVFGSATPAGIKPVEAKTSKALDAESWKQRFGIK